MDALVGERGIVYDARGLVEPDDTVPGVSEIDGDDGRLRRQGPDAPARSTSSCATCSTSAASRT